MLTLMVVFFALVTILGLMALFVQLHEIKSLVRDGRTSTPESVPESAPESAPEAAPEAPSAAPKRKKRAPG